MVIFIVLFRVGIGNLLMSIDRESVWGLSVVLLVVVWLIVMIFLVFYLACCEDCNIFVLVVCVWSEDGLKGGLW